MKITSWLNQENKLTNGAFIAVNLWMLLSMACQVILVIKLYIHQDTAARNIATLADAASLTCTPVTNDFNHTWLKEVTITSKESNQ